MDTMLSDLNFAITYLDDILIKRENQEQYSQHINEGFRKINKYGFKLSDEKSKFFMTKIKYFGQIIDKNSRKPDPTRASGIENISSPTNVSSLQAFLGLANYYVFILNMHFL